MKKKNEIKTITHVTMAQAEVKNRLIARAAGRSNSDDNFRYVALIGSVFESEDFSRCNFYCSKLENVTFSCCDFSSSEFKMTEFVNVKFINCQMPSCEFHISKLAEVSFDHVILNNSEFHYVEFLNNSFKDSTLDSCDFDFSTGNLTASNCSMEYITAPCAHLDLALTNCNVQRGRFNFSQMILKCTDCSFEDGEMNDGVHRGSLSHCFCECLEFKRSDCRELAFDNCATDNMSTDGAIGLENPNDDDEEDDNLSSLEEDLEALCGRDKENENE